MIETPRSSGLTAKGLGELLGTRQGKPHKKYTPLKLLAHLVKAVEDEEVLNTADAFEYIAYRGREWGGCWAGHISVRVRNVGDKFVVQWLHEGGVACKLGDLVDAIQVRNDVPRWYELDWIEEKNQQGQWVDRGTLDWADDSFYMDDEVAWNLRMRLRELERELWRHELRHDWLEPSVVTAD